MLDVDDPAHALDACRLARERVLGCVGTVGGLLDDTTSVSLDPLPLDVAIRSVVRRRSRGAIDRIDCTIDPPPDGLCPELRAVLLEAVVVATDNAVQHGSADELSVEFRATADQLVLEVRDDGSGMDVSAGMEHLPNAGRRLGLLQEQVGDLGGDFELRSAPGFGTTVTVRLPARQVRGSA